MLFFVALINILLLHSTNTQKEDCGIGSVQVQRRSVGSKPAVPDTVPWQVAIYRRSSKNRTQYEYICGGTILTPILILSAAHCFHEPIVHNRLNASEIQIAVGKYTVNYEKIDKPHTQFIQVQHIYIQDSYDPDDIIQPADIAILQLDVAIIISSKVMPICIDWHPYESAIPSTGKIAGWGLTENNAVSEVMRITEMKYLSPGECRSIMTVGLFHQIANQYDKFCTGGLSGPVVKPGDGGSGWTYKVDDRFYIYGVSSLIDLGDTSLAAFTKIPIHLGWIESIMKRVQKITN